VSCSFSGTVKDLMPGSGISFEDRGVPEGHTTTGRTLPRTRWSSFAVSLQALVRWHRELVRRKWTYARRLAGARLISDEVRELIVRIGKA
jgi:hypothetical protein